MSSSQLNNSNSNHSSTNEGNHNIADVLLYAESKLTRKQAVQEIADMVLKANMKPKTVKRALDLLKSLLPPENTLPSTIDELFGAMLSSENDWRLAQYLIKHKQRPSFISSSSSQNIWSENSNSTNSLHLTSSSPIPRNPSLPSPSLFLPISSSSSSSSSSSDSSSDESESESESSSSSASESSDSDNDEDERNILLALQEAQQQRLINLPSIRSSTESAVVETNLNPITFNSSSITTLNNDTSEQRSQIVSSSINRFPFLGSFKRQRSETSSDESGSESDVFFSTRLSHHEENDSDNEGSFYPISNNNNNNDNKSCCFEMNGCDLLDGGKRRRH